MDGIRHRMHHIGFEKKALDDLSGFNDALSSDFRGTTGGDC
jgi:hypothetical protein